MPVALGPGSAVLLLLLLSAWAVQPGFAADETKLWLIRERVKNDILCIGGFPNRFRVGVGECQMCNAQGWVWLPDRNGSGKLQLWNGACLTASAALLRQPEPDTPLFFTWAGSCDDSERRPKLQAFILTEAGRVRLAAIPYLELRAFGENVYLSRDLSNPNVKALKDCPIDTEAGLNYGSAAAEMLVLRIGSAIICMMLLVYVPLALYHAVGCSASCLQWARNFCSSAKGKSDGTDKGANVDAIRKLVADFRATRLQRFSRLFTACGTILLLPMVSKMPQHLTHPLEDYETPHWGPRRVLNETQFMPIIVICLGMLFVYFSPHRRVLVVMDALNVCLSAAWVWQVHTVVNTVQPSAIAVYGGLSWIPMCRVFQALVSGNAKLTTALSLIVSLAEQQIRLAGNVSWNKYTELATCVLIIASAWIVELAAWHEASAKVESHASQRCQALQKKLLSSLCDVVIPLGRSLCITESTPKLEALLLWSSALGFSTRGCRPISFMDWVHAEDREMLGAYINSSSRTDSSELAPSVHVRLIDSLGSVVPVMIVGSTLDPTASEGGVCHILGITMMAEETQAPQVEDLRLVGRAEGEVLAPRPSSIGRSSASSSRRSDAAEAFAVTLRFRAVGGQVTAAACDTPRLLQGHYANLGLLGVTFQTHLADQQAWIDWFQGAMTSVLAGDVSLPYETRVGPTFFVVGKKRPLLDVTVCFPERANLQEEIDDYDVVVRVTRSKPEYALIEERREEQQKKRHQSMQRVQGRDKVRL